jgi:hypothetical protein
MKSNIIKSAFSLALFAGLIAGCANNDDYGNPLGDGSDRLAGCVQPALTVNKTVPQVVAMASSAVQTYTTAEGTEDVIEAYVTSSDERGAFFKVISLQTLPSAGPVVGFSISVDATTLFGEGFYPGRKVYVKLKDLKYAKVDGSLKLGAEYKPSPDAPIEVGRLSQQIYKNHVIPACSEVDEDVLARPMTIAQALNDANLNTLIDLTGVEFSDDNVGKPYYDEFDGNTIGGATNRFLINRTGGEIIFRTSGFANFAGNTISGKSGTIRGVLTKFAGTYQFLARYDSDIMLTEERFDPAPPLGGTALTYGVYNQNFETTAVGTKVFPNAINDAFVGGRYWEVKTFGNNEYIEMTSYAGSSAPGVTAKTLFFIPVDFTAANNFTFKKEFRFMAGEALKVYYVTSANYSPLGVANMGTFVNITDSFTGLTYPATGQSQNAFTTAGTYAIPASLTGTGFFVFEYSGNATVTTTVQIDDIVVN